MSNTLEDFIKKYLSNRSLDSEVKSYRTFKHTEGLNPLGDYARAVEQLYSSKQQGLASYGKNQRNLANKGLQNSGFADYISAKSLTDYNSGLAKAKAKMSSKETESLDSYASYLERYSRGQRSLKNSVKSHLLQSGTLNLSDAVSYGLEMGLSRENAEAAGLEAYNSNKRKVFDAVLEQAANLRLDRNGAVLLGEKMGLGYADAEELGEEIDEMLKYYGSISEGYLRYLEENSKSNTRTFN